MHQFLEPSFLIRPLKITSKPLTNSETTGFFFYSRLLRMGLLHVAWGEGWVLRSAPLNRQPHSRQRTSSRAAPHARVEREGTDVPLSHGPDEETVFQKLKLIVLRSHRLVPPSRHEEKEPPSRSLPLCSNLEREKVGSLARGRKEEDNG